MQKNNIKPMMAAGVMAGVLFVLNTINYYVPVLSAFTTFVLAVPPAMVGRKYGAKWATLSVVASLILQMMLMGPQVVLASATMAILGIVFGVAYANEWGPAKRFLLPSILFPIVICIQLLIGMFFLGLDVSAIWNEFMQQNLATQEMFLKARGLTGENLATTMVIVRERLSMLVYVLPVIMVISGIILTYINVRVTDLFFKRFKLKYKPFPKVSQWQMPEWSIYLLALGIIVLYWGSTRSIDILRILSLNLLVISLPIIFVQGVAFCKYLFEARRLPDSVFYMVMAITVLMPLVIYAVVILGMVDMLTKYRKKREASKTDSL